jgi:RNase adapter protein RapZ
MATKELLIVTGMSGAGRSTVAHALEDLGWYVVDNLPPALLPELATQTKSSEIASLAVVRCKPSNQMALPIAYYF